MLTSRQKTIPSKNDADPPEPPEWLPEYCHDEWCDLWRSGISTIWTVGEHEQVARLAYMRIQFHGHGDANVDTLSRMHPQLTGLEKSLLMTPESQNRAGITVEDPKPARTDQADRRAEVQKRAAAAASAN